MFTKVLNKGTYYLVMLLTSALLLTGCAMTSQKNLFQYQSPKDSTYYLQRTDKMKGAEKTNWRLLAIQALIREGKIEDAEKQIQQLPEQLKRVQKRELSLLNVELLIQKDKFKEAEKSLAKLSSKFYVGAQKDRFYQAKITLAKKLNKSPAELMNLYIQWEKEASPMQQKALVNETWAVVKAFSDEEIASMKPGDKDFELRGWVALHALYKQHGENALTSDDMATWRKQYKNHPAARYLAKGAETQTSVVPVAADVQNMKISVLLPLSGSSKAFGDAIQAGFNEALRQDSAKPAGIKYIDTSALSLDDIVKTLKTDGTNFVVGPLIKSLVQDIRTKGLTLPVLALNRVDGVVGRSNLCYFGLSPEDEAMSAAKQMHKQGKRQPLLIAPKGEFGSRVALAFAQQWQQLAGNNNAQVQYFDSYQQLKTMIKTGIPLSGQLISLPSKAPKNIEADAKQAATEQGVDLTRPAVSTQAGYAVDAIYVVASQQELMLIKPMIDVKINRLKRNDISIYASSRSNSVVSSLDYYSEMNGVQFSETPILVGEPSALLAKMPGSIKNDNSLIRLYAMGFDAWSLTKNYTNLNSGYQMKGLTGTLMPDAHCNIMRELPWQQIRQGRVESMSPSRAASQTQPQVQPQ